MSTHGKPRIISCAELHPRHIALPRGCFDEALALLRSYQVEARVDDRREVGEPLPVRFLGTLREEQAVAFDALAAHDFGVLAASPAFGKTVVAAALIAKRACSTLVLVHRRELLTQWVERLREFLSVEPGDIGTIAGGRKKPTRRLDVAVIQSLVRKGEVSDLLAGYGQLIVDECHHLSAASFELVARRSKAKYVVGLSATVARRDGHQPIIFMQCGPVRHRVNPKEDAPGGASPIAWYCAKPPFASTRATVPVASRSEDLHAACSGRRTQCHDREGRGRGVRGGPHASRAYRTS